MWPAQPALIPCFRRRKIEWFRKQYETHVKKGIVPSVIAHSFGTYVVGNALMKYDELRFDRIVLCGSILPSDFDSSSLIDSGRFNAVLNECGLKYVWVW